MREVHYELFIDSFTPNSIPMSRLAEYLSRFAGLLGHSDHVHFKALKPGSLSLVAGVAPVASAKVQKRLDEVRYGGGAQAARKAVQDIDDMLAEDNALGRLTLGGAPVIEFPGRTRPKTESTGPVRQEGSLDGEVIQIGGLDDSINVKLRSEDLILSCVTSKAIARQLAHHLFGAPVRVRGTGIWARLGTGSWELKKFEITGLEPLDETPLSKIFAGLRTQLAPPAEGRLNPLDLITQLREE